MKKNLLFVVSLLLVHVLGVNAQGSGSTIPMNDNPYVFFTGSANNLLNAWANDEAGTSWGAVTAFGANYATVTSTGCAWGGNTAQSALSTSGESVAGYTMMAVDIYSTVATNFAITLKLAGTDDHMNSVPVPANTWTRIKRAVPMTGTLTLDAVIIAVECASLPTYYFDNVHFYSDPAPPAKAPNPPGRYAGTYLSLYNDQPYQTPNPTFGAPNSMSIDYLLGGESTRKIIMTPVSWGSAGSFGFSQPYPDVNEYDYLNFDIWSPEATTANLFRLVLIDKDDIEVFAYFPALKANTWTSYQVELSDLNLGYNAGDRTLASILSAIKEVRIASDGLNFDSRTVYVDNIYFYNPEDPVYAPEVPTGDNMLSLYPSSVANAYGDYTEGEAIDKDSGDPDKYIKINNLSTADMLIALANATDISSQSAFQMHVWVKPMQIPNLTLTFYDVDEASYSYTVPNLRGGQWNTIRIPVRWITGLDRTRFERVEFSGTGTAYVDNVCFFTTFNNVEPVAEVGGVQYYSIKEAYDLHKSDGGTVEIAVIADSKESEMIHIISSNSNFSKLVIYPKGEVRTVSYIGHNTSGMNNLFYIDGVMGRTIEIDGRVDKAGTERGLIFSQAVELPISSRVDNNSLISIKGENVTVQYCHFKGLDLVRRPENTITMAGANNKILYNHFEDCLFLGDTFDGTDHYQVSIVNVYQELQASVPMYNGIEIKYNDFYETNAVDFLSPITRMFIHFGSALKTGYDTPVQIVGNKIGGTGRNADGSFTDGIMQYGTAGTVGAESSILYGMVLSLDRPAIGIDFNDESKYTVVEGNEVAQIAMEQPTSGFYAGGNNKQNSLGAFTGIVTQDGLVWVKNNEIHDISNKVTSAVEQTSDKYILHGIRHETTGGDSHFISEGNKIHSLSASFLNTAPLNGGYLNGIFVQPENSVGTSSTVRGVIKNNRIVLGADFSEFVMGASSSFSAILGNILNISAGNTVQIDVYDNIVAMTGFKFQGEASPSDIDVIKLRNGRNDDGTGIVNCFNNIVYIQPAVPNSFSTERTSINGVHLELGSNRQHTRFFHNTVVVQDLQSDYPGEKVRTLMTAGNGRLDFFNNNLVNLNTNGLVFYNYMADQLCGDYNNYYSPRDLGNIASLDKIYSFDEWKFLDSNWSNGLESHSRFQYPQFGNKPEGQLPTIELTIAGLESLKTLLTPQRFLGGRKLTAGELGALIDVRTDATNVDINGALRRPYMPTMGAINTSFTNYWVGGTSSAWDTPANWADHTLPADDGDIVFAPDPDDVQGASVVGQTVANDLVLSSDKKVHDIYNDTRRQLNVGARKLTLTGYVADESYENRGYAKLDARQKDSKVVYNGNALSNAIGGASQHIFEGAYVENKIYNLEMANESSYFVLLHGSESVQPTLEIMDRFTNVNEDRSSGIGNHLGGLNCVWHPTTLKISTSTEVREIPQHVIFNDSVYNLVVDVAKLQSNQDRLYVANNLTINSGKNLEIPIDKYVKVIGTTTNSNDVDGLLIKADPTHAKPAGTFIFNKADAVNASVEFYVKASTPEGTEPKASLFTWQYFGSPVETYLADNYHGTYIREFNESKDKGFWSSLQNGTSLSPFTGYEISRYENKNNFFVIKGKLVNRDLNKTLSVTAGKPYSGQYVLSNPYTASLPINDAMFGATGADLEQTIYVFNTGTLAEWEANEGNQSGKAPGQYVSIPSALAGELGMTSIPSMQGFVVRSNGNANNTFSFTYGDNVEKNPVAPRSMLKSRQADEPMVSTKVSLLSDGMLKDQFWLFTDEHASHGFDNGYDGHKLVFSEKMSQLYTGGSDGYYQVNTVPDVDNTYVYFKAEENVGGYTLQFNHKNTDLEYDALYLLDLNTGQETDITADGSTYSFTGDYSTVASRRFVMTSRKNDGTTTLDKQIYLYQSNAMMYIRNGYANGGVLSLYDLAGSLIYRQTISAQSYASLSESKLNTGVYLLRVDVEGEVPFSEKVLVK